MKTIRQPEGVESWPLDRILPFARNPKIHGAEQVDRIAASMERFGWTVPCLVAADGERPEFLEEPDTISDLSGVGWVDERKPGDITEAEGGHLEDDRGQRGALDLGLGELGAGLEVLLGVQPDAHAGGDAAAPTGALRGTGLADRLDRQALHLGALAVPRDAGGAGVDDVPDAGHGQRGLCDVRRQDDPPPAAPVEDTVLLGGREPGPVAEEQREDADLCHDVEHLPGAAAHR